MFYAGRSPFVLQTVTLLAFCLSLFSGCGKKSEEIPPPPPARFPKNSFPPSRPDTLLPLDSIIQEPHLKTVDTLISVKPVPRKRKVRLPPKPVDTVAAKPVPPEKADTVSAKPAAVESPPPKVNQPPRLELKSKPARANLVEPISFRLRAVDGDDSLLVARIRYEDHWDTLGSSRHAGASGHSLTLYQSHLFGKVCKPWVMACVLSADGREACDSVQVEVYNAPPVVLEDSVLHARVGEPVSLLGRGLDPDGKLVKWEWDLDGDGNFEVVLPREEPIQYTFARAGKFKLALRVTSADGMTVTGQRLVEVRKK